MENGPFIDVLPIKMVIFNSYVSLPEGNLFQLSDPTSEIPVVNHPYPVSPAVARQHRPLANSSSLSVQMARPMDLQIMARNN